MAADVISLIVMALIGAMGHLSAAQPHAQAPVPTPIGTGARYRPPAGGPASVTGARIGGLVCASTDAALRVAHVELFARGHVLLIPPGVGITAPRRSGAVVRGGRCRYPIWTDDPTGVVHITRGTRATLASLFAVWGQSLGPHRMCGFRARRPVVAYIDGRRWRGSVRRVPLRGQAEIVVEVGRRIAPHTAYLFPEAEA
ncbi:MAG: hypothetical protein ACRDP6_25390 [Actinoallomurus sp.]